MRCDCDSEHSICNVHNRRSCVVYMSSSTFTQRLVVWYVITSDTKLLSTICFKEPQQGPYSCVVCLLFLRSGVYWWWFHCYVFHSFFQSLLDMMIYSTPSLLSHAHGGKEKQESHSQLHIKCIRILCFLA